MRTVCVFLIAWMLVGAAPKGPTIEERQQRVGALKKDLSADQVRRMLGKPDRVARQILFRKHLEQWVYDLPTPVRVEFLCLPGEEARVLNVFPRMEGFSR